MVRTSAICYLSKLMRWRPFTWFLLSVFFFVGAAFFWRQILERCPDDYAWTLRDGKFTKHFGGAIFIEGNFSVRLGVFGDWRFSVH